MSLERRLQHAARELRAVDVAVPPLGSGPSVARRGNGRRLGLQVVAVPVLFIVGGLVVMGVLGERRSTGSTFDDTTATVQPAADLASPSEVAGDDDEPAAVGSPSVRAPSIAEPSAADERVVIDRILSATERLDAGPAAGPTAGAPVLLRPLGFNGPL